MFEKRYVPEFRKFDNDIRTLNTRADNHRVELNYLDTVVNEFRITIADLRHERHLLNAKNEEYEDRIALLERRLDQQQDTIEGLQVRACHCKSRPVSSLGSAEDPINVDVEYASSSSYKTPPQAQDGVLQVIGSPAEGSDKENEECGCSSRVAQETSSEVSLIPVNQVWGWGRT